MLGMLQDAAAEAAASGGGNGGLMTVDTVGLGLLGLFALLGLWRGLWWQVLRLLGLAAAVAVARSLESSVSGALEGRLGEMDARVVQGITWLGLFLLTLALVALLGRLGKKLLEAMQLGLMDRVGGAVAGAATGILLHAALLAGFVQIAPDDVLESHLHDSFSERLIEVLGVELSFLFDAERGADVQQRFAPLGHPISIGLPPGVGVAPLGATPSSSAAAGATNGGSASIDPSALPATIGVASDAAVTTPPDDDRPRVQ